MHCNLAKGVGVVYALRFINQTINCLGEIILILAAWSLLFCYHSFSVFRGFLILTYFLEKIVLKTISIAL